MQTSFTQAPSIGFPGMRADTGPHDEISTIVEESAGIAPGLVVIRGTGGDRTARLCPAFAADDDAIIAAHATTAGSLVLDDASELDGVVGEARIFPPSKLDLTLSSHADFNATTWPIVYEDEHGVRRTEDLLVPDAGNAVIRTKGFVSRVISLTQPAQAGVGGSFKLGTTTERAIGRRDLLGVVARTHKTRADFRSTDCEVYDDEREMPVFRKGRVIIEVENTFSAGDALFVRCTAAGAEVAGAIRVGDSDNGDCALLTAGATLMSSGGAAGKARLELNI